MKRKVRGMSLTEVLVSLAIFAVGVLGLLGMHATALASFSDAKYRLDAALLADRLLGQVWVDRANAATYAFGGGQGTAPGPLGNWLADVRTALPGGDAVVQVAGGTVTVTVNWRVSGAETPRRHVAVATLQEP